MSDKPKLYYVDVSFRVPVIAFDVKSAKDVANDIAYEESIIWKFHANWVKSLKGLPEDLRTMFPFVSGEADCQIEGRSCEELLKKNLVDSIPDDVPGQMFMFKKETE